MSTAVSEPIAMTPFAEVEYLVDLLKNEAPKGDVVEIGCYAGDTTRRLAEVCMESHRHLYAIDQYEPCYLMPGTGDVDSVLAQAKAVCDEFGCLYLMCGPSRDMVDNFTEGVLAFVYVDGSTKYDDVMFDMIEYSKKMVPGGIMVVHDVAHKPDVQRAFAEFVEGRVFHTFQAAGGCGIGWFRV